MTPEALAEALAELRGWHLPEPVSWWPPAPGWSTLGLAVLALAVWGGVSMLRHARRTAAARAALQELAALEAALARDGDVAAFLRGLSRLLRRFTLARFPRREVAGLTGERWLAFLDGQGGGWSFRTGVGRVLVAGPYRPGGEVKASELAALVRAWIARNARGAR